MIQKTEQTWWIKIYMSGPLAIAEQVCREVCLRDGLCVTVDPTKFIYTGGEEIGFVIGLLNYPRFPATRDELYGRAAALAAVLLERTCQQSVLIVTPETTEWISSRE